MKIILVKMKICVSVAAFFILCVFGVMSHDFYPQPHPYMHYDRFLPGYPYGGMHSYQGYGSHYGGYGNYIPRRKFKVHKRYHRYGRHGYGPAYHYPNVHMWGFRGYNGY